MSQLGKIQVSPNPSGGKIRVRAGETFYNASLTDSNGQTLKTWEFSAAQEVEFDLQPYPAGQYWLLLNGQKGTAICAVVRQ